MRRAHGQAHEHQRASRRRATEYRFRANGIRKCCSSQIYGIVAHPRAASVFARHMAPKHGSLCTPDDKGLGRQNHEKNKNASWSESNSCSRRVEIVEWTRALVHNLPVTGSNPTARTFFFFRAFSLLKMKRAKRKRLRLQKLLRRERDRKGGKRRVPTVHRRTKREQARRRAKRRAQPTCARSARQEGPRRTPRNETNWKSVPDENRARDQTRARHPRTNQRAHQPPHLRAQAPSTTQRARARHAVQRHTQTQVERKRS
jgi:hypothetical protein